MSATHISENISLVLGTRRIRHGDLASEEWAPVIRAAANRAQSVVQFSSGLTLLKDYLTFRNEEIPFQSRRIGKRAKLALNGMEGMKAVRLLWLCDDLPSLEECKATGRPYTKRELFVLGSGEIVEFEIVTMIEPPTARNLRWGETSEVVRSASVTLVSDERLGAICAEREGGEGFDILNELCRLATEVRARREKFLEKAVGVEEELRRMRSHFLA